MNTLLTHRDLDAIEQGRQAIDYLANECDNPLQVSTLVAVIALTKASIVSGLNEGENEFAIEIDEILATEGLEAAAVALVRILTKHESDKQIPTE